MLCYEHHVEMKIGRARLELSDESAETPLYACQEPVRKVARVLHRCTGHKCDRARDGAARPLSQGWTAHVPCQGRASEKKFPLVEMSRMCCEPC